MNPSHQVPYENLRQHLAQHGQEHLLAFWDTLPANERRELAAEIESVDLEQLTRLYRQRGSQIDWQELAARASSPPAIRLGDAQQAVSTREARIRGEAALAGGEVGVLLVAGGQGTRLNFHQPKGMFPIGAVSGATLFQIHLEKVRALARRYGRSIPLYIMTSPATHEPTVKFLEEHERFGIPEEDFTIFCQGSMPAVEAATGKLLLESPGRLFMSPDGHGGTVAALRKANLLDGMQRRGLNTSFTFRSTTRSRRCATRSFWVITSWELRNSRRSPWPSSFRKNALETSCRSMAACRSSNTAICPRKPPRGASPTAVSSFGPETRPFTFFRFLFWRESPPLPIRFRSMSR